jgi:hypothetical protein
MKKKVLLFEHKKMLVFAQVSFTLSKQHRQLALGLTNKIWQQILGTKVVEP